MLYYTVPILIHTSGTGILIDDAAGNYAMDDIDPDVDIPMSESLPKTQTHRKVDLEVAAADKEASLDRKLSGVIGEGLNLWPSIHIDGVETLHTSVFDVATKGADDTGHECEGYYFGENGEHRVGEISEVLVELFA
ncbi:hypothetical protein F4604DRAFT_2043829 [Suillus subluteus]|nr:hypothetical protein F4604DRAFT_2043829 [Suillus subluteus]